MSTLLVRVKKVFSYNRV